MQIERRSQKWHINVESFATSTLSSPEWATYTFTLSLSVTFSHTPIRPYICLCSTRCQRAYQSQTQTQTHSILYPYCLFTPTCGSSRCRRLCLLVWPIYFHLCSVRGGFRIGLSLLDVERKSTSSKSSKGSKSGDSSKSSKSCKSSKSVQRIQRRQAVNHRRRLPVSLPALSSHNQPLTLLLFSSILFLFCFLYVCCMLYVELVYAARHVPRSTFASTAYCTCATLHYITCGYRWVYFYLLIRLLPSLFTNGSNGSNGNG